MLRKESCYYRVGKGFSTDKYDLADYGNCGLKAVKEVMIIQMIICGEMEVIAEVIFKEDFDKYFDNPELMEKEGKEDE